LITDGGRITGVRTSSGEMIEAQIVVGADGCHSTIASLVGARDYHVTSPGRMFAWAYFDGVTDREGRVRIGRRADKGFLAAPTDGGLYMAAVMSDLSQRDGFRADRETHFASGLQGWPELHDVIGRGRRVGPIRAVSKWRGYFRQAAGPGWVLVGDAGHFKDPSPGQGIGDAFRQADHLASAVEDGMANTDPDSEIQRWWRWRDDDAHEMYGFAEDMGRPGASSPLLAQLMRDLSDNVDATQQFLHVLNHDVRPSQLLTPSRAARAAARTLRAKPTRMMSTTSEIVALARQEARRARRKRTFPPGMTGTV
jgi:2-polyprenyl-6-methoxyphenol hydroxylase-like FAD-dependent oxidoreductase